MIIHENIFFFSNYVVFYVYFHPCFGNTVQISTAIDIGIYHIYINEDVFNTSMAVIKW